MGMSLSFLVKKGLILVSKYTKSASSPSEIVESLHKYKTYRRLTEEAVGTLYFVNK